MPEPRNSFYIQCAYECDIIIVSGSSWSFHGREVPHTAFGFQKFPVGHVLWNNIRARELTMYDLYHPPVQNPVPAVAIQVEKITGPVLLISSEMDTMWPLGLAAEQIMRRLQQHRFPYSYRHLHYDYGGHLFVPMELHMTQFFRGDWGKNKEPGRTARMDSLMKTLEYVSLW